MPCIEEEALLAAAAVELIGMLIDVEPASMSMFITEDELMSILIQDEADM